MHGSGAGLSVLLALSGGCTTLEAYSLMGQRYDPEGDCLAEEQVIDVIEGKAQGTCDGVLCLRSQETEELFVSPNCEAPALYDDLTDDEDSACPDALAAYERGAAGLCAE